jgi:hypothetical protein
MTTRLGLVLTSALLIGWAGATTHAQRGFGPPGGFGPGMGKVVTGEPYTATVTTTSIEKLANGTTITHSSTITEARDSQGRTYRCVTTPPAGSSAQGFTRTTVMDPVAHTITQWSTQSTTATQFQLPSNPPGGRGAWAGGTPGGTAGRTPGGPPFGPGPGAGGRFQGQVTRTTLPAKSIAGVNAEGVRTTITVPAGAQGNDKPLVSTREVWTSTDLKIVLLETSDGPRDGFHKTEVTSLTPGESDPTLFQVPQGYTVTTQTRHRGN